MPVKAPPAPATPFVLDVHGFFDTSFKNDYITPRGLLVTNTGLTTQVLGGLVLDIYKDKTGFINDVSIYGGVWNDLWSKQHDPHVGPWNEFDWFIGVDVKFAQNWKFGVQYIEFVPPAADLITSFPRIERNVEFSLSYDDTRGSGGRSPSIRMSSCSTQRRDPRRSCLARAATPSTSSSVSCRPTIPEDHRHCRWS